jgi:glycosyltransferase involved in cell wall biosynthesis
MKELGNLMVSVDMITFGHQNYIRQAIEGVLMQETNFEFDLVIADDCSPDNTQEIVKGIIKNHPKGYRIKYFRQATNIGMNANADFAMSNCRGKYIAICEGDDYWTDPLKLQKQVDFLEANPDYGLCHTDYSRYIQNTQKSVYNNTRFSPIDVFYGLIKSEYPIGTLTVVFRNEIWKKYIEDIDLYSRDWLMGDLPFWLYLSTDYKVNYQEDITSVYRVVEESASNTRDLDKMIRFDESVKEVKLFFLEKYATDYTNINKIKSEVEAIYIYRKIIAYAKCNGNLNNFFYLLFQFHKINREPRHFFGSFKQIFVRLF